MTAAPPEPPDHLALASIFEPAAREQWQHLVATALRKSGALAEDGDEAAVEQLLATQTYDGFALKPLYTADDVPAAGAGVPGAAPFTRGTSAAGAVETGWDVRARHADPDPARTRELVMTDLENGVTSLWLVLGPAGLPLGSLGAVLAGVLLDLAPVVLDAGEDTVAAAREFLEVVRDKGVHDEVRGNLGADPIGLKARHGSSDLRLDAVLGLLEEFPGLRPATVDATVYHDAGGSDAEELGAAIATGVAYLRALTAAGLSTEAAFDAIDFRLAATAGQFGTIAKFRAARRLWARVGEVSGAARPVMRQHAVTSSAMMSRRDPWVNMLRTTLACFGAGVGGADAVTVQPFDAAIGLPDDFSRRIARNTSSLLTLESNVAKVIDPAGGSWYVESLTDDLAHTAWDWFTEIERAGGIEQALDDGVVRARIDATWAQRERNLAHRRDALTGVSEFPNIAEEPVVRSPAPAQHQHGLPRRRYAEDFESLRDLADTRAELTGARPRVFLATLGPVAASTARATFAANLFQAGGFETPTSGPGTDPEAIATAFTASGARVACLASGDKVYAEHAAPVAEALRAAGAQRIWLAGKGGKRAGGDAAAGVTGYVFTGCDALAVLRETHAVSGVDDQKDQEAAR